MGNIMQGRLAASHQAHNLVTPVRLWPLLPSIKNPIKRKNKTYGEYPGKGRGRG